MAKTEMLFGQLLSLGFHKQGPAIALNFILCIGEPEL